MNHKLIINFLLYKIDTPEYKLRGYSVQYNKKDYEKRNYHSILPRLRRTFLN
jgi:hypothetical protein